MRMLTRKQAWRRETNGVRRENHDFVYRSGLDNYDVISKSLSEPIITSGNSFNVPKLLGYSTTGNLMKQPDCVPVLTNSDKSRKVKWNLGVRVVLIPTCAEYRDVGLADLIWWNENDYCTFRESAAEEVQSVLKCMKMDLKDAIKTLYQPEFDDKLQLDKIKHINKIKFDECISKSNTMTTNPDDLIRDDSLPKNKKRLEQHKNTSSSSSFNSSDSNNSNGNSSNGMMILEYDNTIVLPPSQKPRLELALLIPPTHETATLFNTTSPHHTKNSHYGGFTNPNNSSNNSSSSSSSSSNNNNGINTMNMNMMTPDMIRPTPHTDITTRNTINRNSAAATTTAVSSSSSSSSSSISSSSHGTNSSHTAVTVAAKLNKTQNFTKSTLSRLNKDTCFAECVYYESCHSTRPHTGNTTITSYIENVHENNTTTTTATTTSIHINPSTYMCVDQQ